VVPGVQLHIGAVSLEVSAYAVPCRKNAAWFTDGHFGLMHHRHGFVSRAYATVLEPGRIALGDAVVLEPEA
jgi:MOSC domain-containing protein YiiM